jgi:hypothetical protein
MHKVLLSVAALAAMLVSGSFVERAEAVTLGAPAGMQSAVGELAVVDRVHCVPGWPHHTPTHWRHANGCPRAGGVVVVPGRHVYAHRHVYRPHIHVHRRHVRIHRHHHHRHRR